MTRRAACDPPGEQILKESQDKFSLRRQTTVGGIPMEKKKEPPRHGDLHDPKLPALGDQTPTNRAQCHVCPSPLSQTAPETHAE